MEKKRPKPSCCDGDSLIKCMGTIDQEITCFKECGHTKHVNHATKEKILFCIITRDIAKLDKKLDLILRELNSAWDCHSFCDSESISCKKQHKPRLSMPNVNFNDIK